MKTKKIDSCLPLVGHSVNVERLRSFEHVLKTELDEVTEHRDYPIHVLGSIRRLRNRRLKRMAPLAASDFKSKTYSSFADVNALASKTEPHVSDEILSDVRLTILEALESVAARFGTGYQLDLDFGLLATFWRYGPGSSVKSQHLEGDGSFVSKMTSAYRTVTSRALPYVKHMHLHASRHRELVCSDSYFNVVEGSHLSVVAKNEEIGRTICTEPSENQAIQLAAGMYIEQALKYYCGIDLSKQQDINRSLAKQASIDGKLATIDLKSASDLITPKLIELLWPKSWFCLLSAIRSPSCRDEYGNDYSLGMMSTMGNGFTFPVMTLTLYALCVNVCRLKIRKPTVAVFGDDIIVPSLCYDDVSSCLHDAGLIINHDKSFVSGYFRESCGGDYIDGFNVTPFYVRSLQSDAEIYIVLNQYLEWSARNRVHLPRTFHYLYSLLEKPLFVPEDESDYSGIRCTLVSPRYTRLVPITRQKFLNLKRFAEDFSYEIAIMAIVGGYVRSSVKSGPNTVTYGIRSPQGSALRTKLEVRVPLNGGRRTGRCARSRAPAHSEWIDSLLEIETTTW